LALGWRKQREREIRNEVIMIYLKVLYLKVSPGVLAVQTSRAMLWHPLFFSFWGFLGSLCLRFASLPGDGGWNELKWNVAMASVALGDCKQGLQWRGGTGWRWVGGRRDSFRVEHYQNNHVGWHSKAKDNSAEMIFSIS